MLESFTIGLSILKKHLPIDATFLIDKNVFNVQECDFMVMLSNSELEELKKNCWILYNGIWFFDEDLFSSKNDGTFSL